MPEIIILGKSAKEWMKEARGQTPVPAGGINYLIREFNARTTEKKEFIQWWNQIYPFLNEWLGSL